jgi:GNAT superfamily N-acetyltransferase
VTDALRIIDSTEVAPAQLEAFYDEILTPSFDSAELEDRTELLDALADPDSATRGAIAFDATGLIGGGIVGDWFADSSVMLISYLAARPGFRGHGVGKQLIREILPAWASRFGALLIVAEVEDPRFYQVDEQHGDPEARLRFYAGLGAKIVDLPYFQPALSAEQPRVRHLFLMVLTTDQSVARVDNSIDAATLTRFIDEYLAGTEGDVDDKEVRRLREALQSKDVIPLVEPAKYLNKT